MLKINKYSGTENSFFIIDLFTQEGISGFLSLDLKIRDKKRLLAYVYNDGLNLDSDGLIYIEKASQDENDFSWDFYNKDGSSAEMCGNASRCVAQYILDKFKFNKDNIRIETIAGVIVCKKQVSGFIEVNMPRWKIIDSNLKLEAVENPVFFVNTGVPHAVTEVSAIDFELLNGIGQKIRNHSHFGTAGSNATFFLRKEDGSIESITFERGVEGITKSCGTGAVASALANLFRYGSIEANKQKIVTKVKVPGGDLVIDLLLDENIAFLTGEATFHYETQLG